MVAGVDGVDVGVWHTSHTVRRRLRANEERYLRRGKRNLRRLVDAVEHPENPTETISGVARYTIEGVRRQLWPFAKGRAGT